MPYQPAYAEHEPARREVDAHAGALVLEFGAPWCGHCIAAQPLLETALHAHPQVHHLKVEDGRGRPLGRSYRIKLWPTLVLLRDGAEVARLVRPQSEDEIERVVAQLAASAAGAGPR
jgi:thioredoxin 1